MSAVRPAGTSPLPKLSVGIIALIAWRNTVLAFAFVLMMHIFRDFGFREGPIGITIAGVYITVLCALAGIVPAIVVGRLFALVARSKCLGAIPILVLGALLSGGIWLMMLLFSWIGVVVLSCLTSDASTLLVLPGLMAAFSIHCAVEAAKRRSGLPDSTFRG